MVNLTGMIHVGVDERHARLAARHHLAPEALAADPVTVAGDLVGLHSTDPASVVISTAARIEAGVDALAALDAALYEERSLVRLLGMRRTMFVVPRDLAAIVQRSSTDALVAGERKKLLDMLRSSGIGPDVDQWLLDADLATLAALTQRGEALAAELSIHVPALAAKLGAPGPAGSDATVGASTRVLFLLAARGLIVRGRPRGSWVSSQYRWATTERWLGEPFPEAAAVDARRELVRRWLRSYGPGTTTDIAWWTGWTKRDVTAALAASSAEEVSLATGTGWLLPDDLEPTRPPQPWVALLPALDPSVMGWKERDWLIDRDHLAQLFDRTGNVGPTIWADGTVVGGWVQRKSGEIATRLLTEVGVEIEQAILDRAAWLADFLGAARVSSRFPCPLEKSLR